MQNRMNFYIKHLHPDSIINISLHHGLFKWVSSLHQVAKVSPHKEAHIKSLPAMQESQETRVQSLGREDPLEEGLATHSRILAWRIPRTEEPGGLGSTGSHRVGQDRWFSMHACGAYLDWLPKLLLGLMMLYLNCLFSDYPWVFTCGSVPPFLCASTLKSQQFYHPNPVSLEGHTQWEV